MVSTEVSHQRPFRSLSKSKKKYDAPRADNEIQTMETPSRASRFARSRGQFVTINHPAHSNRARPEHEEELSTSESTLVQAEDPITSSISTPKPRSGRRTAFKLHTSEATAGATIQETPPPYSSSKRKRDTREDEDEISSASSQVKKKARKQAQEPRAGLEKNLGMAKQDEAADSVTDVTDTSDEDGNTSRQGMATSVARRTNTTKPRTLASKPSQESDVVCQICSKHFTSRKMLDRHMSRPRVHPQPSTPNRTGPFDEDETDKIRQWQSTFCKYWDIEEMDWRQMMTASIQKDQVWSFTFISRRDFNQEYCAVLPERDKRSMFRYRERKFQNHPDNQRWTNADDVELMRLVREKGHKWAEIGRTLARSQDSVHQRWKHKLKYGNKAHEGAWTAEEWTHLEQAVRTTLEELGYTTDAHSNAKIPWEIVSQKIDGSRTAQQCANKWKKGHSQSDRGSTAGPEPAHTQTSRSRQLHRKTTSNKFKSDAMVRESDSDGGDVMDSDLENEADNEADNENEGEGNEVETVSRGSIHPEPQTPHIRGISSQMFNQTVANTSAPRASARAHRLDYSSSSSRPSPPVSIQYHPVRSSPPLAIEYQDDNQIDDKAQEDESSGDETLTTLRKTKRSRASPVSDAESENSSSVSSSSSEVSSSSSSDETTSLAPDSSTEDDTTDSGSDDDSVDGKTSDDSV